MATHLGLDLGGTNIKSALVMVEADRVSVGPTGSAATHGDQGPDSVFDRITSAGRALAGDTDVGGIGMAVPGVFDRATGVIRALPNVPGWEGFPLRERLSAVFERDVTLVNDAQAFALAEARLGAGRGAETVVAIALGTGIGGGLVIDGRLHVGATGSAGEIGHMTIDINGPECGCGSKGCLEALARPPVVAASIGAADFEEVMARFEAGDPGAVDALEDMTRHLGAGIANLLTILGPDRIVIGGGAAQAGAAFFELVRAAAIDRARIFPPGAVEIVPAEMGVHAGAIGAALSSEAASG